MAPKKDAAPQAREGIKGAPKMKAAQAGCTEAVCGRVEACELVGVKKTKKLTVDVGAEEPLTISTQWDVEVGMRVVIAVVGSSVGDMEIKETSAGGVVSQGMLCDGVMLGWEGANAGSPALVTSNFVPGDSAPDERPRRVKEEAAFAGFEKADDGPDALFEAKLTKEEKKGEP